MMNKSAGDGITFDDVSLVPARSSVIPANVDTSTRLTRHIRMNIPLVSAAMDTVTESAMAIALAQEGGIGIIHRNLNVEAQAIEVDRVKRSENGVISDPVTLPPGDTIDQALRVMKDYGISGIPIIKDGKLVGILTRRDLKFQHDITRPIAEVMTKDNLVTAPPDTTPEQAKAVLNQNKVEKLLLVDDKRALHGLITIKDIDKLTAFPHASRDGRGRLRVGAAIGPDDDARTEALIAKGVDVLVLDTAHGHSERVIEAARRIKKQYDIELIVGNIVTGEAAKELIDAGADAVKVGVGPGSICTTRAVTGVGVPQVTAVMNCAKVAHDADVPVIADGGIRFSGDITKAIAAGASSIMIGGLFAGLDESPGEMIYFRGRAFKLCRGMGSIGAMAAGSSSRYAQEGTPPEKLVPEGIEGRVPYHGPLSAFVYQLIGGLRAGMGYCGAATVEELQAKGRFVRVTPAGREEGHPHDVAITQEAPNYRQGDDWM